MYNFSIDLKKNSNIREEIVAVVDDIDVEMVDKSPKKPESPESQQLTSKKHHVENHPPKKYQIGQKRVQV
jgi:hypothetical protein